MKLNPDRHHRRSIRLRGYDYLQSGAYFVTVCTKDRECLFGEVMDGEMRWNEAGRIVQTTWAELPSHYPGVQIDEFVVMPNHVHGIVVLSEHHGNERDVGAQFIAPPIGIAATSKGAINRAPTLGSVVRAFKARITTAINGIRQTPGVPVWQRNYYEHIIRADDDLNRIRQYIIDNPAQWAFDRENPSNSVIDTGVGAQFIAPSKETWLR